MVSTRVSPTMLQDAVAEQPTRTGTFSRLFGFRGDSTTSKKAPSLKRLLQKRDFERICHCLESPRINTDLWFIDDYSMLGDNCLHLLLAHRPPAQAVELMMEEFRKATGNQHPELSVDFLGQTPLHVASLYLCEPDVIALLVSTRRGKNVIRSTDVRGRLPLHLVALASGDSTHKEANKIVASMSSEEIESIAATIAQLLLDEFPAAVAVRDRTGNTPVDYSPKLAEYQPSKPVQDTGVMADFEAVQFMFDLCGATIEVPQGFALAKGENYFISELSTPSEIYREGDAY